LKKLKPIFSTKHIGIFQFYTGIVVGVAYSISLTFLFNLLCRSNNITVGLNNGIWDSIFESKLEFYYSLFFGLLSSSLGFCFTTYLWSSQPITRNRKKNRNLRIAQMNSLFFFGLIMFAISKFFGFYFGYNIEGFDLNLKDYFGLTIFLMPLMIFLYCWMFISKVYKSKKAIIVSFFLIIAVGLALSGIKT
tara:strand:+ start:222 stop:794 length:573 start_codon:yes stop_codon:yes gene_type:complete